MNDPHKPLKTLNQNLDRLILKGKLSLEEERQVLQGIVDQFGFEHILHEIRRRN
jgi:hypothetical protein